MKVPKKWIINGKEIEGDPAFLLNIAGKRGKEKEKSGKPCGFPDLQDPPEGRITRAARRRTNFRSGEPILAEKTPGPKRFSPGEAFTDAENDPSDAD